MKDRSPFLEPDRPIVPRRQLLRVLSDSVKASLRVLSSSRSPNWTAAGFLRADMRAGRYLAFER